MTIYRLNPTAGSDGTGSTANPWNTLVGKTLANDDTLLIDTGKTYRGGIPDTVWAASRITIAEYGTGALPHITGGQIITMTASASAGVFQWSAGSNICGNATVDGVIQKFVAWNTDLATTAAQMPAGSMTFDYTNFILYVKPVGGTLVGKEVEASTVRNGMLCTSGQHVKNVRNLRLSRFSQHGAATNTTSGVTFQYVVVEKCGGWRNVAGNFYAGNGIEMDQNSIDCLADGCSAFDIFDSAFSSQCYGAQVGSYFIRNHEYRDCRAERFGFGGFEFSTLDTFQNISGIYVIRPFIRDGGVDTHWAGDRGGKGCGVMMLSSHLGLGILDNVHVVDPDIARCMYALSNQYSNGGMRVDGGSVKGITAMARVDQLGSPNYARSYIAVSSKTRVDGPTLGNGYADAITRF